MHSHTELSDAAFEEQFRDGHLDPVLFNHEAHLRLAWIHIKKYGEEQAVGNICTQLIAFTKRIGAKDIFNKTLTVAAVKIVSHFYHKSAVDNFHGFITEFPRLKNNFRELLSSHYKIDIFTSKRAKHEYLEPDLMPFT